MDLSIIVPTYNEGDNVKTLTDRIIQVMANRQHSFEILFVDDSDDRTPLILEKLAFLHSCIRFHHRENERGLATAVVKGFQIAQGNYLIVMDADMQHPQELIPDILQLLYSGVDLVVPSRFVTSGSDGGLNWQRKIVSWTARTMARLALKKARPITDCTGGFFGINRTVIDNVSLNPIGWKILLEIIVKGHYDNFKELPYSFLNRQANLSKMNFREQYNYIRHLAALIASSPVDRRFFYFA